MSRDRTAHGSTAYEREARAMGRSRARAVAALSGPFRGRRTALPPPVQTYLEPLFGRPLHDVRLRADERADRATRALGARAFARDDEIWFRDDAPAWHTEPGAELLLHELAHLDQQRRGAAPSVLRDPDLTQVCMDPQWAVGLDDDELRSDVALLREYLSDRLQSDPEDETARENLATLEAEAAARGLDLERPAEPPMCLPPEPSENRWPFTGASPEVMARYIDDQVTSVAVNLMLGVLVLGLEGRDTTVSVPLSYVDPADPDILPMWPVAASREEALTTVAAWRPAAQSRGLTPVVVYEGPGGLLWPTHLSARTTPRIWSVYPAAFEEARRGALATRDAFVHLAFWYIAARFPVRTRAEPAPVAPRTVAPATVTVDVIEGFTATETAVIREAQTILGSSEFAAIRAAYESGETTAVTIGGRLIQYQADFTYAEAMTLGREGFVMGPRAFVSEAEVTRTVLHELHRLHTSSVVATGAADAVSASTTTRAAWEFAEEAWRVVFSGGR